MKWLELEACPICKGDKYEKIFEFPDDYWERIIEWHHCEGCGCRFQSPRLSEEALAEYYLEDYRIRTQGNPFPDARNISIEAARAHHLVDLLKEIDVKAEKVLDIGASTGALVQVLKDAGYDAQGVEPNNKHREYCQENGLRVWPNMDDLMKERFDLITMAHTLEHIPNPVEYLKALPAHDYLLAEVPNMRAERASYFAHHMIAFDGHSLNYCLREAYGEPAVVGFKMHGIPLSPVLDLYMTVLVKVSPS